MKQRIKRNFKKKETGTVRTVRTNRIVYRPAEMAPKQIVELRRRTLGVSQRLFAELLNVAVQTVHAWEQGRRSPSGLALKVLRMAQSDPAKLQALIETKQS